MLRGHAVPPPSRAGWQILRDEHGEPIVFETAGDAWGHIHYMTGMDRAGFEDVMDIEKDVVHVGMVRTKKGVQAI